MWGLLFCLVLVKLFIFVNVILSGFWSGSDIFIGCLKVSLYWRIGTGYNVESFLFNIVVIEENKFFFILGFGEYVR